jgi:hypothetical protein
MMTPRRMNGDDGSDSGEQQFTLVSAETLRSAAAHHQPPEKPSEEKVSLFWRIFGGTILSIVALLVITAYQSVSNSINDLRGGISHLNESKADLVKKDEYSAAKTRTWDKMTEIEKATCAATSANQQALAALQEKTTLRDQQFKQMDDERKELLKEVQSLRERLARVEATKAPVPAKPVKSAPPPDDDD